MADTAAQAYLALCVAVTERLAESIIVYGEKKPPVSIATDAQIKTA